MKLAKQAIDIGLFTNQLDPMLEFWQNTAGVPFSELLPLGGGLRQHRHAIGLSVFKLNHARDPLVAAAPSGIRVLTVANSKIISNTSLVDPDGNRVRLVPAGASTPPLTIHLTVSDLESHRRFYGEALGLPEIENGTFAAGESRLALTEGAATRDPVQQSTGYRYMTLQIFDVVAAHTHVLNSGGREGSAPRRLGDVAYISFVRDPDGNWIELSQRKSIVGSLD
ncbi:MAG: VOC family protein [Gammaproteobacteria bacterium]|nr:VOC family protein [Gammaproteobacteria bacterium]